MNSNNKLSSKEITNRFKGNVKLLCEALNNFKSHLSVNSNNEFNNDLEINENGLTADLNKQINDTLLNNNKNEDLDYNIELLSKRLLLEASNNKLVYDFSKENYLDNNIDFINNNENYNKMNVKQSVSQSQIESSNNNNNELKLNEIQKLENSNEHLILMNIVFNNIIDRSKRINEKIAYLLNEKIEKNDQKLSETARSIFVLSQTLNYKIKNLRIIKNDTFKVSREFINELKNLRDSFNKIYIPPKSVDILGNLSKFTGQSVNIELPKNIINSFNSEMSSLFICKMKFITEDFFNEIEKHQSK